MENECRICDGPVDITLLNIESSAEEDGVEVNYTCPWCRRELFAVLRATDFQPVD